MCSLSEAGGGPVERGDGVGWGAREEVLQFMFIISSVCDPHVSAGPNRIPLLTLARGGRGNHLDTCCVGQNDTAGVQFVVFETV